MHTDPAAPSAPSMVHGAKDIYKEIGFWFLCALIASLSFSISFFEIFSAITIILALISCVRSRNCQVIKNGLFLLILIYLLINVVSIFQTEYLAPSIRGIGKVLKNVLVCFSAAYLIDSEEKLRKIFKWFLVVAVIIGVDALIQGATGVELLRNRPMTAFKEHTKRITGPFQHANDFSAYLSFIVLLFLGALLEGRKFISRKEFILFLIGGAIVFLCLVGTYSRGAWVAVSVTFVLYAFIKRSKVLIVIILAFAVWGVFFSPPLIKSRALSLLESKDGTIRERRELWGESVRMIRTSPLFGLGVNTYARNERVYKDQASRTDYQYAHNGYLQMTAEIGLVGLLSFLAVNLYLFVAAILSFLRCRSLALKAIGTTLLFGIFSFLIHSATDTDLQSILLINTLWLAIGVTWSARELCKKSAESYL